MMPPKKWSIDRDMSAKYMADEQLTPFVSDFLPTTQVELTLSCRNLINADIISKSDPYCVVSMRETWQTNYYEVARDETIDDNLNPAWVKKVILNYNFETIQKLKFEVWDQDLRGSDFLGQFETTLSDLVSHNSRQFVGNLCGKPNRNCGEIIIVTEEVTGCRQVIHVQFSAQDITQTGCFCLGLCSNDPFLVISRSNEDSSYSVVAKTEVVHGKSDPNWKPFTIRATTLCNGDFDRTIKIECYAHKNNGDHKLIGTCYSSLRGLCAHTERLIFVNEKNKTEKLNHTAGELKLQNIRVVEEATFFDYIRNGTQMHFAVAIDFTASNGVHTDPNSLHYLSSYRLNYYEIALHGVGDIIQYYNNSKMFPAFGFGARLSYGHVSHQFPLNNNASHPYCSGIDEILLHYRNQLNTVQLCGPTNFSQCINNTASIAAQFQDGRHYFVLLIITDGQISDLLETKRAIIDASTLPMSIIIVGVGDADFDNMDELDADDVRLNIGKRVFAKRDIVQFVPLNKFIKKRDPNQFKQFQADLAKEVLAEVPEQLTSFMKLHGFQPKAGENIPQDASVIVPTAPISQTYGTVAVQHWFPGGGKPFSQ